MTSASDLRKHAWFGPPQERWRIRSFLVINVLFWFAVAVLFSVQGYAVSAYRGTTQPWWPSFGYSLAIFSVWAALTLPLTCLVRHAEANVGKVSYRLVIYVIGLPVTAALHVGIFAFAYWPIYNDGGRISTRWSMGERMFLSNLDTNTIFYVLLVAGAASYETWSRRRLQVAEPQLTDGRAAESSGCADVAQLKARFKGGVRWIPLSEIDWIGSAGDYSEVHAGNEAFLLEESLTSLSKRLPPSQFARIHRQTLVQVDRIAELRGLGRGDALVRLRDGVELRLSRRYRNNLASLLRNGQQAKSRS
jgi:hypothetical protein